MVFLVGTFHLRTADQLMHLPVFHLAIFGAIAHFLASRASEQNHLFRYYSTFLTSLVHFRIQLAEGFLFWLIDSTVVSLDYLWIKRGKSFPSNPVSYLVPLLQLMQVQFHRVPWNRRCMYIILWISRRWDLYACLRLHQHCNRINIWTARYWKRVIVHPVNSEEPGYGRRSIILRDYNIWNSLFSPSSQFP